LELADASLRGASLSGALLLADALLRGVSLSGALLLAGASNTSCKVSASWQLRKLGHLKARANSDTITAGD
jgi:uncharacterized protein YjbI with pentapeptide repeats